MRTKFFVILILAAIIPSTIFAQTDPSALILSLQKQVLELLKQIQTLQTEIGALKSEAGFQAPSPSPTSISPLSETEEVELPEFTRSLSLGTRGDDVRKLQEFLARDKGIYPEGLTTGYYGPKTAEAVRRWQRKNSIEAVGIVGPKTIAKFRELGRGVAQGLIEQDAGPSTSLDIARDKPLGAGRPGVVPPGLMTSPGVQRQTATTTTPTIIPPMMATATPSMATTTPAIPAQPATPATPATPGTTSAVPATPATPATPAQTTTPASNELKVTSPNGGETWYKGNSYTVTWQNPLAAGFTNQEKYYWNVLLKRGNMSWQGNDTPVPVTQSSYVWSKWTGWAEPIPNANDFKVGISLVDTCAAQVGGVCPSANISISPAGGIDYSDGYFTATSTPTTTPTSTNDTLAPSTPTNLTAAVISQSQIRLSWTASTDNTRVSGYKVYRDGVYVKSVTLALDVAPNSAVDTFYYDYPLNPATTYTYNVAAYDAAGNVSAQSLSVTTTTLGGTSDTTAPVISSVSTMDPAANGATIIWFTNEASDSQVEYGLTTSYGNSTAVNTALKTEHSVGLTGLTSASTYHYRVKSKDGAGNLAISNDYTFITLGAATTATTSALPDLILDNVTASSASGATSPYPKNEIITIPIRIKNIGQGAVNNSVPSFSYTTPAGGQFQGTTNDCPTNLAAGATCNAAVSFTFTTSGTKTVYITLDPNNAIAETNENNGGWSVGFGIQDPALTCTDSDNGINPTVRGTSQGPYGAGATGGYIFGENPNISSSRQDSSLGAISIYYDHCADSTKYNQLNEGFCDGSKLSSFGYNCQYGCRDGVCLSAPTTSTSTTTSTVLDSLSGLLQKLKELLRRR